MLTSSVCIFLTKKLSKNLKSKNELEDISVITDTKPLTLQWMKRIPVTGSDVLSGRHFLSFKTPDSPLGPFLLLHHQFCSFS